MEDDRALGHMYREMMTGSKSVAINKVTDSNRQHELRILRLTIRAQSLRHLEAQFLHPLGPLARNGTPLHLPFGSSAAVLTPVLLLATLAFLLETLDDVDGPARMRLPSARRFPFGRLRHRAESRPAVRPVQRREERIGSTRQ